MSSVFAALSLTKGRAMTGMRSEAGIWPFWLLLRRSYGTDMLAIYKETTYMESRKDEVWGI